MLLYVVLPVMPTTFTANCPSIVYLVILRLHLMLDNSLQLVKLAIPQTIGMQPLTIRSHVEG